MESFINHRFDDEPEEELDKKIAGDLSEDGEEDLLALEDDYSEGDKD